MSLIATRAEADAARAACFALRTTVFVEEQQVPLAEEFDAADADATHVLARLDDAPVGAARFLIRGDTLKLQRICVMRDARGLGVGAALTRFMLAQGFQDPNVTKAWLSAQTHALAFYEKLGFVASGAVYDDVGIPHRDMTLARAAWHAAHSPATDAD